MRPQFAYVPKTCWGAQLGAPQGGQVGRKLRLGGSRRGGSPSRQRLDIPSIYIYEQSINTYIPLYTIITIPIGLLISLSAIRYHTYMFISHVSNMFSTSFQHFTNVFSKSGENLYNVVFQTYPTSVQHPRKILPTSFKMFSKSSHDLFKISPTSFVNLPNIFLKSSQHLFKIFLKSS